MRGSCSNASCSPRPLLIRRGASRSSCMCKNIRSWLCTWLCSAFTSNPPGHHKTRTINQHNDQRARMVNPCASGNMVTSLIQQRRAGGACSSLPLALRWRVLAARHKAHQASFCLQVDCLCIGSRHEAPTGRASLRVLHGAKRRPTQGSSLPLALRWRVLTARHHAPGTPACGFAFATNAAVDLRLIEQACGCRTDSARRRPT